MSKKVLIVSSSLRANSNSELLAREAERGARDAGYEVESVSLKDNATADFAAGRVLRPAHGRPLRVML